MANKLADVVNDDTFQSLAGKSKHQLWLELCDVITKHPSEVTAAALNVDAILRGGIRIFPDEVGRLWTSLADFYIRRGLFEKARDVYEEGLATVITVRDFSLIFDAYTQFEESVLSAKMEAAAEEEEGDEEEGEEDDDEGSDFLFKDVGDDLDLRLARLEFSGRRPASLFRDASSELTASTRAESSGAVRERPDEADSHLLKRKTVDPAQALGKPHALWVDLPFTRHGDADNAVVFEKAVRVPIINLMIAHVWCE